MLRRVIGAIPGLLLVITLATGLSACSGGGAANKVNYYLIDPVPGADIPLEGEWKLAIEILDLHIPQYLQRFQLVTRDGDNRLRLSQSSQWAENLRKNLLRTLAANLATRLSTIDIGTPLNRSASMPDYRLHVHVTRFERDADGRVRLTGRWQIADANEKDLGMFYAELSAERGVSAGGYDQAVADMQTLFGEFCDRIAQSIRKLEDSNEQDHG